MMLLRRTVLLFRRTIHRLRFVVVRLRRTVDQMLSGRTVDRLRRTLRTLRRTVDGVRMLLLLGRTVNGGGSTVDSLRDAEMLFHLVEEGDVGLLVLLLVLVLIVLMMVLAVLMMMVITAGGRSVLDVQRWRSVLLHRHAVLLVRLLLLLMRWWRWRQIGRRCRIGVRGRLAVDRGGQHQFGDGCGRHTVAGVERSLATFGLLVAGRDDGKGGRGAQRQQGDEVMGALNMW